MRGPILSMIVAITASEAIAAPPQRTVLPGHIPSAVANSIQLGPVATNQHLDLAITFPMRNEATLDELLAQLYDSASPNYGRFLSPGEFAATYGATAQDYEAVANWAVSQGLVVTGTHSNRLVLDVSGSVSAIQNAFAVRLQRYQALDGHAYYAPLAEPSVPAAVAGKIAGIAGLDSAAIRRKYCIRRPTIGTLVSGPSYGLTPKQITVAYNLKGAPTGKGQTLGLFELDGYTASDISAYVKQFGLAAIPLQNVYLDKVTGSAGSDSDEVTLDIELQNAIAPGASKLYVYEGPNSDKGTIDVYNRIATDKLADCISTSWGLPEEQEGATVRNAEQTAFKEMAAQGQSIFAAAGDEGAYDNGVSLSVDDPGSQPYMCSVGGTSLRLNASGAYLAESAWNEDNTVYGGAGGGGISTLWKIPTWQNGVITRPSLGSIKMRNVPDVALNADPYNGYAIYYEGEWTEYGGTSCAAPLWAGFTALANQSRTSKSKTAVGFPCPMLYTIATGTDYSKDFHDIDDGTTNLYYPSVKGYDLATGWGSFNGLNLLADLLAQP